MKTHTGICNACKQQSEECVKVKAGKTLYVLLCPPCKAFVDRLPRRPMRDHYRPHTRRLC